MRHDCRSTSRSPGRGNAAASEAAAGRGPGPAAAAERSESTGPICRGVSSLRRASRGDCDRAGPAGIASARALGGGAAPLLAASRASCATSRGVGGRACPPETNGRGGSPERFAGVGDTAEGELCAPGSGSGRRFGIPPSCGRGGRFRRGDGSRTGGRGASCAPPGRISLPTFGIAYARPQH